MNYRVVTTRKGKVLSDRIVIPAEKIEDEVSETESQVKQLFSRIAESFQKEFAA